MFHAKIEGKNYHKTQRNTIKIKNKLVTCNNMYYYYYQLIKQNDSM